MATKKAPKKSLFDQPPSPSPSPSPSPVKEQEEEDESESESETGSEEEGEEEEEEEKEKEKGKPKTPLIQQQSQVNKKPSATASQSTSESEEEEEEESEAEAESPHSPSASDFTVKPINPLKPTSKDSKPALKRPSEAQKDDEKDSRIMKKAKVDGEESKKDKSLFALASGGAARVWSEEDVIKVLQGIIDYQDQKGADPSADMGAFYDFVKGKLQTEFSKTQIYDKVRGLKRKYFSNVEKIEKGEDLVFSKPNESKAFDLSKRIWGDGRMVSNGVVENVNGKSNNDWKAKRSGKTGSFLDDVKKEDKKKNVAKDLVKVDGADFGLKYPFLSGSFDTRSSIFTGDLLKENLSLIGIAKAKELEGKWKKLREAETELLLQRLTLMTKQTKLVLEGMKKSTNSCNPLFI